MPRRSGGSTGKALGRPRGGGSGLSPAVIQQLVAQGFSYTEIGQRYGVSRQAVSKQVLTNGGDARTNVREEVYDNFPWAVPSSMHRADPNLRMRDHAQFMVSGGDGMSERQLYRLKLFYNKLERNNWVVEFDPDIPPSKGISTGGFAFRDREPGDGDLMIRPNDHTRLTDEGRRLWRIPPIRP